MLRCLLILAEPPIRPLTPTLYIAFVGRLFILYVGVGVLGGLLSILAFTAYALASATPEYSDSASVHGCAVVLPNTAGDFDAALAVRTTRLLSTCDESTPVAFGASIRDSYTGGRR